jgi:hypothetical protein
MAKGTKKPNLSAASQDEERFNFHLELSSEWYWEQDESYRFTLIKGESFERAGIDPRQLYGTTRWAGGAAPTTRVTRCRASTSANRSAATSSPVSCGSISLRGNDRSARECKTCRSCSGATPCSASPTAV